MTKQIGIVGIAVDSGNRGVLALGSSLVNLCSLGEKKAKVILLSGCKDDGYLNVRINGRQEKVSIENHRLSFQSGLSRQIFWIFLMSITYRVVPIKFLRRAISSRIPWISAVENCQIVGDVRGGDSFSDIYGMKRFIMGFIVAWSVILIKGNIVQFPQTYGPFKSRSARLMASFLLQKSSVIIARDKESRKVALELLGERNEVKLSPDVAFSLEVVLPETIELAPVRDETSSNDIIGINVNGLIYNGGYDRQNMFNLRTNYPEFLKSVICDLLKVNTNAELWLVPHTYAPTGNVESDNEACKKVRDSLPDEVRSRVRVVTGEYDQHEIKGVIGQSNFFLGSRMHSCIAALSQGIPCVGLAYSMKFRGVFSSVGMKDWVVDARTTDTNEAVKAVLNCYHRREVVRKDLKRASEEARGCLNDVFKDLVT